jgi:hypothetical protein
MNLNLSSIENRDPNPLQNPRPMRRLNESVLLQPHPVAAGETVLLDVYRANRSDCSEPDQVCLVCCVGVGVFVGFVGLVLCCVTVSPRGFACFLNVGYVGVFGGFFFGFVVAGFVGFGSHCMSY